MKFRIADLFCGAGGTSEGAMEAAEFLGRKPELTAINHWPVAITTHEANHPAARSLCTGVDAVNPRDLFAEGELDLLWASPECTHHSVARGGKPINDQSRATAWCVIRWAESLLPPVILVENVPEFQTWGPLIRKRQKTKVEVPSITYRKWRRQQIADGVSLKSQLSRVTWWNSITLGTREIQKLVWLPDPKRKGEIFRAWVSTLEAIGYKVDHRLLCAADYGDPTTRTRLFIQAVRGKRKIVWPEATHSKDTDLMVTRRWTPAREIIDWSLPAGSIFERKKPLSPKTLARIEAGLRKFGLKGFILPQQTNPTPKGLDEPVPTVVAEGSGPKLVQPYIVAWDHTSGGPGAGVTSIEEPLSTVVTKARHGVAEPFLVSLRGSDTSQINSTARSLDDPAPSVTASGKHIGLAEPFLVNMKGQSDATDIDLPAPTITAHAPHLYMASPFLIKTANGVSRGSEDSRAKSLDEPMPTVCGNRGDVALIEPFIMSAGGPECGARPVSQPVGTVLTRDHRALVQPHLLPQQSDGRLRPVSEPVPTVSTAGAIALVEPFLVSFYGNGQPHDIDEPAPTVTCKDRFGLVRPVIEIEGHQYLLDIRFRMLQPHELALAQGFPRGYQFTGTKTDQVKQIGNAVPRRLARAIVGAVLSQNPNVTELVEAEEGRDEIERGAA